MMRGNHMMHKLIQSKQGVSLVTLVITVIVVVILAAISLFPALEEVIPKQTTKKPYAYSETALDEKNFNILVSDENKDLEDILVNYAKSKGYRMHIDYIGTLQMMNVLNKGQKYDAIWSSNSIWTYMIDSKVASLKDSKSTSITPVIFGIKKSKAEELGFMDKTVYTKDLVDVISKGNLKFTMSNPNTTNSGASAYLGMLYTLAGNPEVLTEEMLESQELKEKLKTFFSGVERSAGSEDFLEEAFLKGDYEAVFTYESSIIKLNQKLKADGKEELYAIYPVDGVSVCDNPFAYIDHKDDKKKQIFLDIQSYLLSSEGKKKLQENARRTWYGGINSEVDQTIFNPDWGINTTKYITPVKFPSTAVIRKALVTYQNQLRKPVHVVFCLDYSGSMYGEGIESLRKAMHYILTKEAENENIQFSEDDKIDIVPFSSGVEGIFRTDNGVDTDDLLQRIDSLEPGGGTAIYEAAARGIEILKAEDTKKYNVSIILMTDGMGNIGSMTELSYIYHVYQKEIPIYSIMFGAAEYKQLQEIAELTNGKVFDGKVDLVEAFKEVRGYN